jgi:hypothetical protein
VKRVGVALGVALALTTAPPAVAQFAPTLDVGVAVVHNTLGQQLGVALVSPTLRYGFRGGQVATSGALSLFDDGAWGGQGSFQGDFVLGRSARALTELQLSAGGASYPGFEGVRHVLAGAQISGIAPAGGWHAASRIAAAEIGDFRYPGAAVEATAWRMVGEFTFSAAAGSTLMQRADTAWVAPLRVGATRQTALLADLSAGLRWSRGVGAVDLVGGRRFGRAFHEEGLWGTLTGSLHVTPDLTFTAGIGRQPADLLRGLAGGDYAVVGARIGVGSARTRPIAPPPDRHATAATRLAGDGRARIRVHLPEASAVTLRGDLTEWQPLAMTAAGGGTWELFLQATAGIHQICISVDGAACAPPPGLPTSASEFGVVGVLAVP